KDASTSPKIIIVGAGTAGLVCAYRLQQRRIVPLVIEASTRAGGRMFTLRNFFPDNQLTELGGELVDTNHKPMQRLLKELGLSLTDLGGDDTRGDHHTYFFNNERLPTDASFIEMFRPAAKAIAADLRLMKVREEGEETIGYDTPHAREVDR